MSTVTIVALLDMVHAPAMNDPTMAVSPSPWHSGERALQERYGVAEKMERVGRRVIRDYMPDQHRSFFEQLPFVLVGSVDARGAAWASILVGAPGFLRSPDPRTLSIAAQPPDGDPAQNTFAPGVSLGLLGIELHTRRRNRMNGKIRRTDHAGIEVAVEQSFGNCPQYIHPRLLTSAPASFTGEISRVSGLDDAARNLISQSDTFFVASYVDEMGDVARRSVDVSHRGGDRGFVRSDGDVLTIPDFSGNLHFNTLGNLVANPRAGLLFVDFDKGDVLQLTGRTEVILQGDEIGQFEGAERLWRFTTEEQVLRRGALALRGPALAVP